jgi:hypothetical protein
LKKRKEKGKKENDMKVEKEEEGEYYAFNDHICTCMTVTIGGI